MQPLGRVESAIDGLSEKLDDIDALPRIEVQLIEMNRGIAAILEALGDLRSELRAPNEPATKNVRRA